MPFGTPRIFHYNCPRCGASNTAKCAKCGELYRYDPVTAPHEKPVRRAIIFGDVLWRRTQALAKISRVTASEFVRLAVAEKTALAPRTLTDG